VHFTRFCPSEQITSFVSRLLYHICLSHPTIHYSGGGGGGERERESERAHRAAREGCVCAQNWGKGGDWYTGVYSLQPKPPASPPAAQLKEEMKIFLATHPYIGLPLTSLGCIIPSMSHLSLSPPPLPPPKKTLFAHLYLLSPPLSFFYFFLIPKLFHTDFPPPPPPSLSPQKIMNCSRTTSSPHTNNALVGFP
jgi:hypothetical protein